MKKINIGLIGLGTVGAGFVKALRANGPLVRDRLGLDLNLKLVAERDWKRKASVAVPAALRAGSAMQIVSDPSIDILIELIGGCGDARKYITAALRRGKNIVTANKALLAEHGLELFALAGQKGVDLYYEASVCGAIPVIKTLREGLASNRIYSIFGIVNGTCNYILSRMTDSGIDFKDALREAQRMGYAEADPSLDIEGVDSAHKLTVLAASAGGNWIPLSSVHTEGITHVGIRDVQFAREFRYVIKLLGIFKQEGSRIEARVHPTLIPESHLLASVGGAFNAVCVKSDPAGEIILHGSGAGQKPTSSAVLSDVIDIALNIVNGSCGRIPVVAERAGEKKMREMEDIEAQYYLRFSVIDRPGVLAGITGVLGRSNISIASVLQSERRIGSVVPVVMMTHRSKERNMRRALSRIDRLPFVKAKTVLIRVEDAL